jgi:hypothetical protein
MKKNTSQGLTHNFLRPFLLFATRWLLAELQERSAGPIGSFAQSTSSTIVPYAHVSPGGWTIGPLVAAVQRRSFAPSTWSSSIAENTYFVTPFRKIIAVYSNRCLLPQLEYQKSHFKFLPTPITTNIPKIYLFCYPPISSSTFSNSFSTKILHTLLASQICHVSNWKPFKLLSESWVRSADSTH